MSNPSATPHTASPDRVLGRLTTVLACLASGAIVVARTPVVSEVQP